MEALLEQIGVDRCTRLNVNNNENGKETQRNSNYNIITSYSLLFIFIRYTMGQTDQRALFFIIAPLSSSPSPLPTSAASPHFLWLCSASVVK